MEQMGRTKDHSALGAFLVKGGVIKHPGVGPTRWSRNRWFSRVVGSSAFKFAIC